MRTPFFVPVPPPAAPSGRIRETVQRELADTWAIPRNAVPARPLGASLTDYRGVQRLARELTRLLVRVVVSEGPDAAARAQALGVEVEDLPTGLADAYLDEALGAAVARPDVVVGPDGPQFLEFNVAAAAGGAVELHCWLRAWNLLYRRGGRKPFTSADPVRARAALLADLVAEHDRTDRVLWIGSVHDLKWTEGTRYFDIDVACLQDNGLRAEFVEAADVPTLLDDPDATNAVGFRNFTTAEWSELGLDPGPVWELSERGALLLSTRTAALADDKTAIAWLSEGRPWMSTAEHDLVRRHLPWTRIVAEGATTVDGERVDLCDHLERAREELVLKGVRGMQGTQVYVGREQEPSRWRALIDEALTGATTIAQRYVEPERTTCWISPADDSEPEPVTVAPVLSPFVVGNRPAGVWARFFADPDAGAVVSRDGHGAMENALVGLH